MAYFNDKEVLFSPRVYTVDGRVTVDDHLDLNSTNPVQNKVVAGAIGDIDTALDSSIAILDELLPPVPITFSIGGIERQALSNMTWLEWVNSEYNINGFVCNGESDYVFTSKTLEYAVKLNNEHSPLEKGADKILSNEKYTLVDTKPDE